MSLEDIIARGNRGSTYAENNRLTCTDGFSVSVIAGAGVYCRPRPDLLTQEKHVRYGGKPVTYPQDFGIADVPYEYAGPFTHVEVGYPSERPQPWHCTAWSEGYDSHDDHEVCDGWAVMADGDHGGQNEEFADVYGYVPVDRVRALIAAHGGESS